MNNLSVAETELRSLPVLEYVKHLYSQIVSDYIYAHPQGAVLPRVLLAESLIYLLRARHQLPENTSVNIRIHRGQLAIEISLSPLLSQVFIFDPRRTRSQYQTIQ
jgi:hypothetical protein